MEKSEIFFLVIVTSLMLFSCSKEQIGVDLSKEAVNEESSFSLAESGYMIEEAQTLSGIPNGVYTEGVIEYKKDGQVLAAVDFGAGTEEEKAKLLKDGIEYEIDLKMDAPQKKIKKLIVTPLVKVEDCGFEIVSGMIKYFDFETDYWLATIEFGDGSCDDEAIKVTVDGLSTFTISEYY